jgi:heterodisulfide reductase subunit B
VLGIETVDYPDKNLCCGVGVGLVDRELSTQLIHRKLNGVHQTKAKALIAHCPSCIQSYDYGQKLFKVKQDLPVPVFHYLEVLGLALGLNPDEFAFNEHQIKIPEKLFR